MNRFAYRLRRLATLSPSEVLELLEAQLALLGARWTVSTRPVGKLVTIGAGGAPVPLVLPEPRLARLALAVGRAAEHGLFRPTCLVRAIALQRMLEARGVQGSQVRVGVRSSGDRFAAHAWVEFRGTVLGDFDWRVQTFSALHEAEVAALS